MHWQLLHEPVARYQYNNRVANARMLIDVQQGLMEDGPWLSSTVLVGRSMPSLDWLERKWLVGG